MQFLEFVTRRLMGEPAYGRTWVCPWCDASKPSLALNPPKAGCETKLRCFNCGKIADAFDLARYFRSDVPWPARIGLVHSWERDYRRLSAESKSDGESGEQTSPNGEAEGDSAADAARAVAWVAADAQSTFAEWGLTDDQARRVVDYLAFFCTRNVTVQAVAEAWAGVADLRQKVRQSIHKVVQGSPRPHPTPKRKGGKR
jgi:hypothetical protein